VEKMVRVEKVSKYYGDVVALSEVDLEIKEDEFVTLLGPSGSGKSTLLNIIAGITSPTSGKVYIRDIDTTNLPPNKREIGMVFQSYSLMPHMTIYENLAFPLNIRKLPKKEIKRRITEVLELVKLPGVEKRKPQQLSGGQQQRISIARCLIYSPSIILMDEPLGALDKKLREEMQLEIKRLHNELGHTFLYVTHDQEEAFSLSDRIVLMNEGGIEQIGDAKKLYFFPNNIFSAQFVGDSNIMEAVVELVADKTVVKTRTGQTFLGRYTNDLSAGQRVKIIVRPENLKIIQSEDADHFDNIITGKLIDSVILGGVVKHYIDISRSIDGLQTLAVVEHNRKEMNLMHRGTDVTIGWAAEDLLVLPNK
jgi:putative spermidine/putrescine transport system ATP-binding protein